MPQLKIACFSISIDGFGAGLEQSLQNPFGVNGMQLPRWMIATRTFKQMIGGEGGTTGTDDDFAARGFQNIGAWILGRNMFGPVRGPWIDEDWKGWWGANPPYHTDVFVLTHHPRKTLIMEGGTTFHFITEGIEKALRLAFEAARGADVRLGGGVATVRQYLRAGLVDEIHFAVSPVVLGSGEHVFTGIDLPALGYTVARHVPTENANHIFLQKG